MVQKYGHTHNKYKQTQKFFFNEKFLLKFIEEILPK